MAPAQMGKQEALKRFATNLTEKARKGEIDPVSGRDEEIRQIVDILMRRRQNNPILTGEAGVGKTAVVEGFALRIATGDVPPPLQNVSLCTLDIGLLQAGASMKGEFENRLRQVIDEVQASPKPIILFIDEAHTLIGAGGAAGTGDAANLLKPALARGDAAHHRRNHVGGIQEVHRKRSGADAPLPGRAGGRAERGKGDPHDARRRVRRSRSIIAVQMLDEALEAAVRLSHRYIPARQLPDKAVSLLDTACARVAISQHGVPPSSMIAGGRSRRLETELEIIGREEAVGIDVEEPPEGGTGKARRRRAAPRVAGGTLGREKKLVDRILEIRAKLRKGSEPVEGTGSKLEQAAQQQKARPSACGRSVYPGGSADTATELGELQRNCPRCRASRR